MNKELMNSIINIARNKEAMTNLLVCIVYDLSDDEKIEFIKDVKSKKINLDWRLEAAETLLKADVKH